jgi:hypothetical protein
MPYQPYDTGWIKSIYGGLCLAWLLCTNSSLSHLKHEIYSICYDNICIPIIELFNKLFHMIGNTIISFGEQIVKYESIIFHHFNYIDPIFNGFKRMGSIFNTISVDIGPPSFHCCRSNRVDTVPHLVDTYALTMPGNIVSLDNKLLAQVCLITSQRMAIRKLAHLLILIKTVTARTTPIHSIHLMTIHIVTLAGMMQSLRIGQKE